MADGSPVNKEVLSLNLSTELPSVMTKLTKFTICKNFFLQLNFEKTKPGSVSLGCLHH